MKYNTLDFGRFPGWLPCSSDNDVTLSHEQADVELKENAMQKLQPCIRLQRGRPAYSIVQLYKFMNLRLDVRS